MTTVGGFPVSGSGAKEEPKIKKLDHNDVSLK